MEDALKIAYIAASISFVVQLFIRSKRYFVRKSVSGEVLLKFRPFGLKIIGLYILTLMLPVAFAMWTLKRYEPEPMLLTAIKVWLILNSWIIISTVFSCFPTKVCENGIIDSMTMSPGAP